MKANVVNPIVGIYPATSDYVHAMEVTEAKRFLFVSGTMGLDAQGVAPPTLDEQLKLIWDNIRFILAEANMSVDNIMRLTSYLSSRDQVQQNQDARIAALGGRRIPTTAIVVTLLAPAWLIEIEIVAAA